VRSPGGERKLIGVIEDVLNAAWHITNRPPGSAANGVA